MEIEKVLALYDAEMRINPPPEPGLTIERDGKVVRAIGDSFCFVCFSDLKGIDANRVVAAQTAFFRSLGKEAEWKVFGHDFPYELGNLLKSAGYLADPSETLMLFDLDSDLTFGDMPAGMEVKKVTDAGGLAEAVAVSSEAFGKDGGWRTEWYIDRLFDPTLEISVIYAEGRPVSAARLWMPDRRSFASLWGGCTIPEYRHRGIYRSMIRIRAEIAKRRGYRYITVDARETSRPILERLGFVPLDTIVGWVLKPRS